MPEGRRERIARVEARGERRAISRVRQIGNGMTEAAKLDMPPNNKRGQTEHVGCKALLDGNGYWQLT